MKKGGPDRKKRSILPLSNKFQDKILMLNYIPIVLIFLVVVIIVSFGNPVITRMLFHTSFSGIQKFILQFSIMFNIGLCLVVLGSFWASIIISRNMVGAFERIISEMDDIIAGKSAKPIMARPDDVLANDLLKRVNVFIEGYVKSIKEKV